MSVYLERDIQDVTELRASFYSSLGLQLPTSPVNYDLPLEVWTYNEYFRNRKQEFQEYELKQIETSLKERFGIATNMFIYSIDDDGDLINNLVPAEKFITFLKRGILYRESIGSKEQEREQAELEGFIKITQILTSDNTPEGTMMVSISGPGPVKDTFYPKNFIDIYQKTKDENGQVVVKMTRFNCSNDYEEYIKKVTLFNPDYFKNFEGTIDAWFLKNPIQIKQQDKFQTPEELFSKIFNNEKQSMEEEEFQKLLEYCMPLINNLINLLCSDTIDSKLIALNQNAILNKADEFIHPRKSAKIIYSSRYEEIFYLGMQSVRAVDSACGTSGGINLTNRFDNSVTRFGIGERKWVENCGNCGKIIKNYISAGYKCDCGGVYLGC